MIHFFFPGLLVSVFLPFQVIPPSVRSASCHSPIRRRVSLPERLRRLSMPQTPKLLFNFSCALGGSGGCPFFLRQLFSTANFTFRCPNLFQHRLFLPSFFPAIPPLSTCRSPSLSCLKTFFFVVCVVEYGFEVERLWLSFFFLCIRRSASVGRCPPFFFELSSSRISGGDFPCKAFSPLFIFQEIPPIL